MNKDNLELISSAADSTAYQQDIVLERETSQQVLGEFDKNLAVIDKLLPVSVTVRSGKWIFKGSKAEVELAVDFLGKLVDLTENKIVADSPTIKRVWDLVRSETQEQILATFTKEVVKSNGKTIRPKSKNQLKYIENIQDNTLTFGVGPAGTGKTFLAVASAVNALKTGETKRIILTRPAVEAGERLGFLPGSLSEKIDPYLRPLFDALNDLLSPKITAELVESGTIEIVPLAFMRGRTLNDSFIILDEAQNTTNEQMKMFLTRLGFDSKMVITGDISQVDLPKGTMSGLKNAISILDNIPDIAISLLDGRDIIRHKLVSAIVTAYDKPSQTKSHEKETK